MNRLFFSNHALSQVVNRNYFSGDASPISEKRSTGGKKDNGKGKKKACKKNKGCKKYFILLLTSFAD